MHENINPAMLQQKLCQIVKLQIVNHLHKRRRFLTEPQMKHPKIARKICDENKVKFQEAMPSFNGYSSAVDATHVCELWPAVFLVNIAFGCYPWLLCCFHGN